MIWYYEIRGSHVHVKVYINGALCGTLTFREEEFNDIFNRAPSNFIQFINQTPKPT